MNIEAINERLLRAIGVGVAILAEETLSVRFRNQAFSEWFESAKGAATVPDIFPDLDITVIRAALAEGGRYAVEANFRRKRRTLVIAMTFTRADAEVVVLECQNITRIRELESMIDSYSTMVERNTRDIQREKERVEKLLLNLMPRQAYEEYKTFGVVSPQSYEMVSVLTLDFVDFDRIADTVEPAVMVSELNDIYGAFDRIGEQFSCERIKTVGDAYFAVCGLPESIDDHAVKAVNSALRFLRYVQRRNETHPLQWNCRIGIASGAVIGSVVGAQRYLYDVFGPAVNLSQRLRDQAGAMEIVCCETAAGLIEGFRVFDLGAREVAGYGTLHPLRIDGLIDD